MTIPWRVLALVVLLAGILTITPARPATAAGAVGSGTANSCTETALESALAGGGRVTFDCGNTAVTIRLTGEKTIAANT